MRSPPVSSKKIYLDYASSTPLDPRVFSAMRPFFLSSFGNPGSLHGLGQEALRAVDSAREIIAGALRADFREVLFTASATEANNLALRGVLHKARKSFKTPKLIISAIEHESVRETAALLRQEGVSVEEIPVSSAGVIDAKKVLRAVTPETVLVSLISTNNEIGSIAPIGEIGRLLRSHRGKNPYPLFHTDVSQTFIFSPCLPDELFVDFMTLSSQKIYGPKGVGALYARKSAQAFLSPVVFGGGQEYGFRSGTENVPAIVGFGKAVALLERMREKDVKKISALATYFGNELLRMGHGVGLNGPALQAPSRAPHILNVFFKDVRAETLLTKLDMQGVEASAGSACKSRAFEPSKTISALGAGLSRQVGSVRFSLGRGTTRADIMYALRIIKDFLGS